MVQYAVTLKDGDWTVFCDGQALEHGMSRSAAIQMAKDLAFDAEERGESVVQDLVVVVEAGIVLRLHHAWRANPRGC